METSQLQSPSIESFSYSWLANLKPALESPDGSFRVSLDASDEGSSFIEMDPKLSPSKRFFVVHQDFNFDFPIVQSPLTLVHADELISNGFLVPLFVQPLNIDPYDSISIPSTPHSSPTQENVHLFQKIHFSSSRRYQRFPKRILLEFVRSIWLRIRGRRSNRRVHVVKNWENSPTTSPRSSSAYSADNWQTSCDSETSIYEAVLHCKRTIGSLAHEAA